MTKTLTIIFDWSDLTYEVGTIEIDLAHDMMTELGKVSSALRELAADFERRIDDLLDRPHENEKTKTEEKSRTED